MATDLAANMRPRIIEEIFGQQHLVGENKIIWRMVKSKRLSSMILYGPPGIGKTSIASALSGSTGIPFEAFNASVDSKAKLQQFAKKVEKTKEPMIILLDEIHRLDKPKQDFLLPFMESGDMIIIGATTENPHINIAPAIRSRASIFELEPLNATDMIHVINHALQDTERGLGNMPVKISDETIQFLASSTNGDVRSVLRALEIAVLSTPPAENNDIEITLNEIEQCVQKKAIDGDASGDAHYNVISALQKSIRGSDVNAALHYLARILEAGDLIIAIRRLLVIAYEDVGLADPLMGPKAFAAVESAKQLGLPEARIPLANLVVDMCLSPKSNMGYKSFDAAAADLTTGLSLAIPRHLRDGHYKGATALGNSVGYLYPHDYQNALVPQQYLPDDFVNHEYLQFDQSQTGMKYKQIYDAIHAYHKPTQS